MKVRVKSPFYDNNGLHVIGEIIDVNYFDTIIMEEVKEDKTKAVKAEAKVEPKKAPAKKKG